MKKRFLLLTLIMCLFGGVNFLSLKAQEVTITGNGAYGDSQKFPINTKARYSVSQQLYHKEFLSNLPNGAVIKSIAFWNVWGDDHERSISLYLKNTEKTSFEGTFVNLADEDRVYSGTIETSNDYNDSEKASLFRITLSEDFVYTGENLIVCVYDNTGNTISGSYQEQFKTIITGKQGNLLYHYGSYEYDIENLQNAATYNNEDMGYLSYLWISYEVPVTGPTAPTLISPEDETTGVINPTLQFTLSNNTTQYQILLDKNEDPITAVNNWTDGNGDVSYQTSDLDTDATYYWKVIAKNDAGEAESEVYSFTTLAPPTAPTLVSPTNETTGVINPTLQFTLSDNTTQYQILLDKNEDPAEVVKEWTDGNGDVSYQTSKLEAGTTYYWKVIAKNGAGEAESDIYQFTTSNIFPVTEYEIKLNGNNITLEWQYADQEANQYQVCFGNSEVDMEPWHQPEWMSRDVVEGTTLVEDGSFTFEDGILDKGAYFRVNVRKDEGEPVEGATAFFVVLDEEQEWADSYNNANDVFVRANVSVATNITAKNITIENGGILKIITNVVLSANTLVVNEGGQFFAANTATYFPINKVKFNKNIANPDKWEANNKTGWQFISSPFKDASISSFIPGQEEGDYDLYKYDGSADKQWVNHKESGLGEKFAQGIGYLASYETKDNLTFTGSINRTNKLVIGQDGMMETQGIYLLGNPFLFNMDWKKISASAYGINATSFVVVKADGAYEYKTSGEIKVGEGFFVLTTVDWASFNHTFKAADIVAAPSSKSRNAEQSKSLNIIATGNAGNDNVVVNFNGEGEGFPKLQNFNDDIATVYVQNNDANYGIYNCDENTTEVELCFNANQMGNYTISAQAEGKFETLTLVDRFTGIETNLLVEDYTFTAMSEENNNRFFIRLGNGQQTTDNSHFAYVSGEDLIIEAEGTVQIIDMMGRVVYSSDAACHVNRINVSEFNNAAYVVRVINENEVKVQKIIL